MFVFYLVRKYVNTKLINPPCLYYYIHSVFVDFLFHLVKF